MILYCGYIYSSIYLHGNDGEFTHKPIMINSAWIYQSLGEQYLLRLLCRIYRHRVKRPQGQMPYGKKIKGITTKGNCEKLGKFQLDNFWLS